MMETIDSLASQQNVKKVFWKLGTCSRTFFYLLNREFDHRRIDEERAADPLAGGIMQQGYQCGMLWGASLAVGAEAYRRCDNRNQAIRVAIKATQTVMQSFVNRTNSVDCLEITGCDFNSNLSMAKYVLSGKFLTCYKLAEKWAPEAIESAIMGLSSNQTDLDQPVLSCAAEVARLMGASDEEMIMVAGFAGGLGLSGNGCGALSAAIWMKSLEWARNHPKKSSFNNPDAKNTFESFKAETDHEFSCQKICGQKFETVADHTAYIESGGCAQLIDALVKS